jgi:hypothetical protein
MSLRTVLQLLPVIDDILMNIAIEHAPDVLDGIEHYPEEGVMLHEITPGLVPSVTEWELWFTRNELKNAQIATFIARVDGTQVFRRELDISAYYRMKAISG